MSADTALIQKLEVLQDFQSKRNLISQVAGLSHIDLIFFRFKTALRKLGLKQFFFQGDLPQGLLNVSQVIEVDAGHHIFSIIEPATHISKYHVCPIFFEANLAGFIVTEKNSSSLYAILTLAHHLSCLLMREKFENQMSRKSTELKYRLLEVESLIDVVGILNNSDDLNEEVYGQLLLTILLVLNASKGLILLREKGTGLFSVITSFNIKTSDLPNKVITENRGLLKILKTAKEGLIINDVEKYPLTSFANKNAIACPLVDQSCLVGCIIVVDKETRVGHVNFTPRDLRLCNSLGAKISLAHSNFSLFDSLKSSNKLVESIMSSVNTAILKVNVMGEVEYVNQSALRILGVGQGDMLDQHYRVVLNNNPELIKIYEEVESQPQRTYAEDVTVFSMDGTPHQVNLTLSPVISDQSDDMEGFVFSIEDLSEIHRVKSTFKKYVSENIVDEVLSNANSLELGGAQQDVCILFCDIRGFTAMSEKLRPSEVVYILNHYFEAMIDVVFRHGGTLDKIIGDELMVLYGVPVQTKNDIDNAVATAFDMFKALSQFNKKLSKEGFPELKIGIGINFGPVVCGNIGSKRQMNYTVIGDAVNVAARLCSNAKPGEILISQAIHAGAQNKSPFTRQSPLKVKGKSEALEVLGATAAI